MVVCLALASQSLAHSVGSTLWPLFVRDRFGWSSAEFSYLLMTSSICSTASVAALPTFEATLGRVQTSALAMSAASFFCFSAFAIAAGSGSGSSGVDIAILVHGGAAVLFFAAVALLEPSLKSLASTTRTASEGGRSFGVLASVIALGNSVGSVFGTRLYAATKDSVVATGAGPLLLHAGGQSEDEVINATGVSEIVTEPGDGWLLARQPQLARLIVPGALPFVIVSVVLVLTAVSFVVMDGAHGWLLGNSGTGVDTEVDRGSAGSSKGKSSGNVVGGGEGKKALGPPGKTT